MSEDSNIITLMVDSNRPIHHNNVHADDRLIIIEEENKFADCPTQLDIDEVNREDESDEDEESEKYFDEDKDIVKEEKVREEIDEDEEEEGMDEFIGKKRAARAVGVKRQKLKARKEKSRRV